MEVSMLKEKNIFVTTLSETKNRLDINYYMCETLMGTNLYTTGISAAEAGIKYMLSLYKIDEIVMIGADDGKQTDKELSTTLTNMVISDVADYDHMSEYDFIIRHSCF